jgi:uncharacterized membrane protein
MTDEFESKDDFPEDAMPEMDEPSSFKASADDADMDATDDDKLWALLAYVLTPLIPIIIMVMEDKKERPFLRAHNAQALAWGVLMVIVGMVSSVVCGIPALLMWLVGIYWGWQAYQGQLVEIPVLTDFVKKQGWA